MPIKNASRPLMSLCAFILLPLQFAQAHGEIRESRPSCEIELQNQSGGSISLWSIPQRVESIAVPLTSMEKLKVNLGFTPDLKHEWRSDDESLVLHYPNSATSFARLMYSVSEGKLKVELTVIAPLLTKKGMISYLVGEMLAMNPQVTQVEGILVTDNLNIFHRNHEKFQKIGFRSREKACADAMRETPFYKSLQSVGFDEILECDPGHVKKGTSDYLDYPRLVLGRGL